MDAMPIDDALDAMEAVGERRGGETEGAVARVQALARLRQLSSGQCPAVPRS